MLQLLLCGIKKVWTVVTTWSDILSPNANWGDQSGRQVCAAASISTSGEQIRVTVEAATTGELIIDNAAIVERSGSTANGTTTPTEILFGGTSGVTIAQGTEEVSDWLVFTLDETKDYLLICDINDNAASDNIRYIDGGGDGNYNSPYTDSYNTQNMGGVPVWTAGRTVVFNKMEVKY